MFWWVYTATTPGAASAAPVSSSVISPLATVLIVMAPCSTPATSLSAAYRAAPVTFARPSTRSTPRPTNPVIGHLPVH
jgi:hypothetical protein